MTAKKIAVGERLDELFREHPEGFVAGRDLLAKELRAAGEREEAARVKKLRRPSVAAWLINRAALTAPDRVRELAESSRRLEDAQRRALEGDDDAVDEWRAAAASEREAAEAVVADGEAAAREAGHPAGQRALELAGETLRAAAADAELRERVLAGRVEREQSAATLGVPAIGAVPKRAARSAKRRETTRARRETERLEADLADAEAAERRLQTQVDQTAETLKREKGRLADVKRETAALRRRLKAAERRARD